MSLKPSNYTDYIEIRHFNYVYSSNIYSFYYFDGALDYAYYDNVVITWTKSTSTSNLGHLVKLSAGGYGDWFSDDIRSVDYYEVTYITGTVSYWL